MERSLSRGWWWGEQPWMGEQPSTKGLWLQGVPATPARPARLLGCFLSAEGATVRKSCTAWKGDGPEGGYLSWE